ncbi:hypothetical protein KR009_009925, partial [Drosophila setifemur]
LQLRSGAPSQFRRPKNRPQEEKEEEQEEEHQKQHQEKSSSSSEEEEAMVPDGTVLQMPAPSSSQQSGLVLGVCCDQLMAVSPLQKATKTPPDCWENQKKKEKTASSKWLPPFFIVLVSVLEIVVFVWLGADPPEDSLLVYRPDQRLQLWRFLSYALLHASWLHLGFNVLTQLLFGLPLELVHGSLRTGVIYMAGVLAGSLGTSVVDSEVYLVGSSGGVYALLAAQLASLLLNFGHMRHGVVQLMAVIVFVICDFCYALYARELSRELEQLQRRPSVSYIAHMTGALAGISVGLLLLRQLDGGSRPRPLRWLALGVWCLFSAFGIAFNLVNTITAQLLAEEEGQVIRQHLMHDLGMG